MNERNNLLKTLLVSFFNSSNLGDLLISDSLKNKVSEYSDVICLDYLGNEVSKDMSIEQPVKTPSQNNHLKSKIKKINGATGLNQLVMRLKKNRDIFSYPAFEEHIEEVDALVIGGGNMIFDLESDTLSAKRTAYYIEMAKERNLPVFAISMGIGPFHNQYQQKYTAEVLAKCDFITFRDNKSLALFKKYQPNKKNVGVVPDPVFFMENKNTDQVKNKIGLNVINSKVYANELKVEQVEQNYINLVCELLEKIDQDIIIFNTEAKDYAFCRKIYNAFADNDRVYLQKINQLSDLYALYNQLNLIIGTRMHSMITGFSQGIPIVGLSYQQKVTAMFEFLNDNESVFDLAEMETSQSKLVKRVQKKLSDKSTYHSETQEKLEEKEKINSIYLKKMFHIQ